MGIDWSTVRLSSPGGIKHKVVDGLKLKGDDEKLSATLSLFIRATDFEDFLEEMFPQPSLIGTGIQIVSRLHLLGAPYLRLKSFDTDIVEAGLPQDPMGADPSAPLGTYAPTMRVNLTFETMNESEENPPDENDPITFLEHSLNAGAEYLQIPPKRLEVSEKDVEEYVPGGAPPNDAEPNKDQNLHAYKVIPTIEHSLKWKYVLRPAWTTIFQTLGKVNSSQLAIFNNAKRETVLFTGLSGQRTYRFFRRRLTAEQQRERSWSLDFKFAQRNIYEGNKIYGWNHVYSPAKTKWVRIIRETGVELYETADLLDLFKSG